MTDINIRIRSQFDNQGTAAARKEIEGLVAAIKGAAAGKAPDPGYGQVAAQARTASQAVAGMTQAELTAARAAEQLAQAQNRTAQSAAQAAAAESRAEKAALQLAQAQAKASQAAQSGGGYFQQMSSAFTSGLAGMVGPAAAATAAIGALKSTADLTVAGASAQQTRAAFDQLAKSAGTTGDALLAALRKASAGEISDLNLQLAANRAQLLGVANSAQQFSTLMDIARDRAQKMGITTTQAFNDLVTGLGRGSPLILDNLGITVNLTEANAAYAISLHKSADALTDAEKKQALINAVLKDGAASIAATGGAVEGSAVAFARLGSVLENIKNSIGGALADTAAPTANALADLGSAADGTAKSLGNALGALPGLVSQLQGFGPQSAEATAQQQAFANQMLAGVGVLGQYLGIIQPTSAATTTQAAAALQSADAEDRRTQATQNATIATTDAGTALAEQAQKSLDAATQAENLATFQRDLANLGGAVAGGLMTSANAALALTQQYDIAYDAALRLINAQAALAQVKVEGRAERDTPADRAQARAAGLAAQRQRDADSAAARSAQILATGTTAQKRAELQKQYDAAVAAHGKESAEAIRAQTALTQAQQQGGKGRAAAASGGADRLAAIEQSTGQKLADIDRATQAKLLAIDERAAAQRAAAAKKLQQDMAAAEASRRAANEADDLDAIGVTDPKEAQRINNRERAQAQARQRDQQAQAEARQRAAAGEAETAEKIYNARQEQIQKQQELDEKYYNRQQELANDPAALAALDQQYAEATRAYEEEAQTRIAIAESEAAEKVAAAQAEKDAVIAAAEEQKNQVVAKAQQSAAGIKAATASARSQAVADLQAIGAAVNAIPEKKTVTVSVQQTGGAASSGASARSDGAYAGGGNFVTNGTTTITVGDNPGGRELVTVTPLSGTGTTRPVPGGVAMAGGGVVDAGNGYTTPIAGAGTGSGRAGQGGASHDAPAALKDQIDQQRELIALLSDLLQLRSAMASELESGTPFDAAFAQRLAQAGARMAAFVRDTLPTVTKNEAEGYQRATAYSKDAVAWLSDLIQLRKDMSDHADVQPFDSAFVQRLVATGKRLVALVQAELIPTTQNEVDRLKRWQELSGATVSLIKDVSGLNAHMFSDYVPPSDAQLNAIVRDADRIAARMVQAAKAYDTKGLTAAKAFNEAVGGTFSTYKDGLLFFQALNSGDFDLKPENLARFEASTTQAMAVSARLGAMARKIPSQDIAALQLTTQALAAQSDALIKLAAVPFADLPAAAQALQLQSNALLGGARGVGDGNTIYLNVYPAPGMNVQQLTNEVIRQLNGKIKGRG